MKLRHTVAGLVALGQALAVMAQAKPLDIWISSFQDQLYYEGMVKLYKQEVDKEFEAKVQSFGFREMPEKLAVGVDWALNWNAFDINGRRLSGGMYIYRINTENFSKTRKMILLK